MAAVHGGRWWTLRGRRSPQRPPVKTTEVAAKQAKTRSPLTDSNRRPPPYHGGALPTELRGRSRHFRRALTASLASAYGRPRSATNTLGGMVGDAKTLLRRQRASDTEARLSLLGAFALSFAGRSIDLPTPAQRLLAYLAIEDRPLQRGYLAAALWLDSTDARPAL